MKTFLIIIYFLLLIFSCNKENPNEKLQTAIKLANQDEYGKAIEVINQIIKDYPDFATAYLHRGVYLSVSSNKTEEVFANINKAIQLDPAYAEAYYERGTIKEIHYPLFGSGEDDYNKAILLNSNYSKAYLSRACAKNRNGQYQEALVDIEKAKLFNNNSALLFCARATSLIGLDRYNEALKDIAIALQKDSLDETAYYLRCIAYYKLNDTINSCIDCKKALKLGSKDAGKFLNEHY